MLTSSLSRNWFEIILWWEIRRIPYNLIMYFAGLLSFYVGYISIPLIYILMGLAFNVIYTFGWIIELSIIKKYEDAEQIKCPTIYFHWVFSFISNVGVRGCAFSTDY